MLITGVLLNCAIQIAEKFVPNLIYTAFHATRLSKMTVWSLCLV
jgi:hypothetical protein